MDAIIGTEPSFESPGPLSLVLWPRTPIDWLIYCGHFNYIVMFNQVAHSQIYHRLKFSVFYDLPSYLSQKYQKRPDNSQGDARQKWNLREPNVTNCRLVVIIFFLWSPRTVTNCLYNGFTFLQSSDKLRHSKKFHLCIHSMNWIIKYSSNWLLFMLVIKIPFKPQCNRSFGNSNEAKPWNNVKKSV